MADSQSLLFRIQNLLYFGPIMEILRIILLDQLHKLPESYQVVDDLYQIFFEFFAGG